MRIISGIYGGRPITVPRGSATHPMSERVRQALFNSLGSLTGKTVWDAFAGSGALALEAISRGARSAVATDRDRGAFVALQENIIALGVQQPVKAVNASCQAWSRTNQGVTFDIIFCDPPYTSMQLSTVSQLKKHLNGNGLMLLSYPGRDPAPNVNGVVVVDNRNYGDAALAIYRTQ